MGTMAIAQKAVREYNDLNAIGWTAYIYDKRLHYKYECYDGANTAVQELRLRSNKSIYDINSVTSVIDDDLDCINMQSKQFAKDIAEDLGFEVTYIYGY